MATIIDNKYFHASHEDNLAVVEFKKEIFNLLINLEESKVLTDFIRETEVNKHIRGLLLLNQPDCIGEEAYDEFMKQIGASIVDEEENGKITRFNEKNLRFRKINILNKFIKFLANYQKLYFAGLSCDLATPFIGVVLVADFRLGSPKARFSFTHQKYGLHPSGGLPFFFLHYLGHSRAMEVMLSPKLSAKEALELGLIDRIIPAENFAEHCKSTIEPLLKIHPDTLKTTKRLMNFNSAWLEDYFDFEASLINL